ncbi:hypothetical protein CkaCkLH20_03711 [Colletotrichum karsti]|uniref:CENP-V/GFA domain-containing protein n=1 Tax=Colletotrichum karsti TaxID=1095194 RepID=A0A9P6IE12_9PEZI|nr:uncharacterized protein CkaCkLH20_03711 [Colletotrichum karsti]KAF9878811.1 hypothetical protein CkaCkLH20_03711 [Colletotrichum karsti]
MQDDIITITAQCLCKAHTFTTIIGEKVLPLKASCCHCNSCRHVSGALYSSCAPWPNTEEDLSGLAKYSFSDRLDLFACKTCSSRLFCSGEPTRGEPWVVTGALENAPGLIEYANHLFLEDTIDGGASIWLPKSENVKRWRQMYGRLGGEEMPSDWPVAKALSSEQLNAGPSPEVTPFYCHCKGVNFVLRSAADLKSKSEEELKKCFIDPKTLKYRGSFECCDSCRLSFGADLMAWTFAPLSHIDFPGDTSEGSKFPDDINALKAAISSENKDPRLGTLASYQSSPGVDRYFCSKCSASVFYAVHDRPWLVDVAVGLLDHPDGARAEGLLLWFLGRIGWFKDAAGGWREGLAATAKELQLEYAEKTRGTDGSST